jgi:hypothetical protein
MFLMQWTSGAAGFLNTFVAPIALKNIGYWVSARQNRSNVGDKY